MLSRALTTRLSTTDLISWALTQAVQAVPVAARKTICLPLQFCRCCDHVEHALDQLGQVGRLAARLAAAAEFEQPLRDLLAAKRLFLNHLQVLGDDLRVPSA